MDSSMGLEQSSQIAEKLKKPSRTTTWSGVMAAKITRDVLESYLNCKFKAHLKLAGQQGTTSDYEALRFEMRAEVRLAAIDRILAAHPGEEIPRNVPLTTAALKQGASFLLDATLEDDLFSLTFDGLKKVDGPSKLGDFHYIPILFSEGEKVRKAQCLLLELYGLLLSGLQGKAPGSGVIWHGKECIVTRVRLNTDHRQANGLLRAMTLLSSSDSPRLLLNDHCKACEFRQHCQSKAIEDDNISLLRGIGEKEITSYAKKGILTVTQLSFTFRPRRKRKRKALKTNRRYHSLQALAIRDRKTYVLGSPAQLPPSPVRVYLDVEGVPETNLYYLIGLLICNGTAETQYYFWADSKSEEAAAWKAFVDTLCVLGDFCLYHYGSYESRFIASMDKQYGIPLFLKEAIRANSINVLSRLYAHVYLPTYSNDLKSVATFLGWQWSTEGASGIQSIVWRNRWERTKQDELKRMLITYNQEDCQALRVVADALDSIANNAPNLQTSVGDVVHAEDLKRIHPYGFGRNPFFFPEWERINKCAYFDYQRERVYLRTNPAVRKSIQREQKRTKNLRMNKTVSCEAPSSCIDCGTTNIIKHRRNSRLVYDLKLFNGGIKRWIVRFFSRSYLCKQCGRSFLPAEFQSLSKYGHKLLAWTVYRNIELRQSHGTIISELEAVFGFTFHYDIVAKLKVTAAKYYQLAYNGLVDKLRNGRLIHADETKVSIKGIDGYVWAFTNLQEVVYVYSDTREGNCLTETIGEFTGMLVSDFYAAYDSIQCIQQKCLIHLIRDINDDLFKNPFDEELKNLAKRFSEVMVPIIETIDKFGLKQHHLNKHRIQAQQFIDRISSQTFESALAKSYQKRIHKYRGKLFVFLEYDEVPWNNNNAEHAIKRFAFLRQVIGGSSTAKGIREYLVLLSVCETLRLRGISVFKFLMSGATGIDQYTVQCGTGQ